MPVLRITIAALFCMQRELPVPADDLRRRQANPVLERPREVRLIEIAGVEHRARDSARLGEGGWSRAARARPDLRGCGSGRSRVDSGAEGIAARPRAGDPAHGIDRGLTRDEAFRDQAFHERLGILEPGSPRRSIQPELVCRRRRQVHVPPIAEVFGTCSGMNVPSVNRMPSHRPRPDTGNVALVWGAQRQERPALMPGHRHLEPFCVIESLFLRLPAAARDASTARQSDAVNEDARGVDRSSVAFEIDSQALAPRLDRRLRPPPHWFVGSWETNEEGLARSLLDDLDRRVGDQSSLDRP